MPTLSPPPLDGLSLPVARWFRQLWDTLVGDSNLDSTRGTVANTTGVQTLQNKLITNLKDNTRCYARAGLTSAQSVSNATYTIIAFATETDSRSAITGSGTTSFRFTVPAGHGGLYLIAATVTYDTAAGAGINLATVFKNGSEFCRLSERSPGTTTKNSTDGSTVLPLLAGDYIDLRSFHDSGAARNLTASAMSTHLSIVRLVSDL